MLSSKTILFIIVFSGSGINFTLFCISLKDSKNFVTIYIDDFGPGILKENEEKIFSRFYSKRPKNEAFGKHSGLGLSIAKQIVEIHSGSIKAKNRLNIYNKIEGARFIISFKQIQEKTI